MGVHIGITWRIRLNRPCVAAMRPFCQVILTTGFAYVYFICDVVDAVTGGQVDGQSSSDRVRHLSGIYIKHVKPDSPAGASGLLKDGDRILEVFIHNNS